MSDDIYRILENLDAAQRSVKQLPALFRPANTSPQLSGPYPGKNATLGYLVGEDDKNIMRGGYNKLRDQDDYADKRDFLLRLLAQASTDEETQAVAKDRLAVLDKAAQQQGLVSEHADSQPGRPFVEAKHTATEDVLDAMKRRLGDYLQDVATAIKKDPDLKDRIPQDIDQIRSVKTLRTDDGHEIKITGNEDDGFRVTIKNQQSRTKFPNLDEATMAVEMYCARRSSAAQSQDYIEEA